jgi:hypothetical protein
MKVIYRHYEPDQGLEDIQARIYNEEHGRSPKSAFREVTAEQIKQRFVAEEKDPKWVRYALKEDGSPMSYIQTSFSENPARTWIGYPWAMEDCPVEVQEKLYEEMLEYVKDKYPDNEIVMGYLTETWKKQVTYAESKGFTISDKADFYALNTNTSKVSREIETDQEYIVRMGDQDDVDILIELCKADPRLERAFPDDEAWVAYFKDRVLPEGHAILLFKDEQLVCAGAPLKGFTEEGIIVRFTAIRPGFQDAWKELIREIALHCKEQEWAEPLLFNSFINKELSSQIAEELGADLRDTQVLLTLKK